MLVSSTPGASVLLAAAAALFGRLVTGTAVNVALEASFGRPPYLLELLETAAEENPASYFPILDRIAEGRFTDLTTEKEVYEEFLAVLKEDGHINAPEALSTFRLALALHTAAPRIEAHYQYYNTSIGSVLEKAQDASCPVWVHFNDKQYCSPTLERAQQDYNGPNGDDLPFDRSVHGAQELPVATLYVDINSPLFPMFHQTLSDGAKGGKNDYRIRYRPSVTGTPEPLRVGGYGVELQLKRTDYIVIDDREAEKSAAGQKPLKETDLDDVADLKPLSASELLGLGLKTSSYIMDSEEPFETLARISQDFPKYSSSLAQRNASDEFVAEHEANRAIFLPAGYNVLFMNGLQIPARQMDAYALLDRLRQERTLVHGLQKAGLSAPEAISLISHEAITNSKTDGDVQRYDWRDSIEGGKVIIWLNDIEKDSRYAEWSTESTAFLQRLFPGQLPQVRRDLHNMVLPLDFTTPGAYEIVLETMYTLVQRKVPIRFGFIPTHLSPDAAKQARVIYHLRDAFGVGAVIKYLQAVAETKKLTAINDKLIEAGIGEKEPRKGHEHLKLAQILESATVTEQLAKSETYLKRLGAAGQDPVGFINGVPTQLGEQWMQSMSQRLSMDLQYIQQKVYMNEIGDDVWLAGEFLTDAPTHRNPLIVPEDEDDVKMVDVGSAFSNHKNTVEGLPVKAASSDAPINDWAQLIVVIGNSDDGTSPGQDLSAAATALKGGDAYPGVEIVTLDTTGEGHAREGALSLAKDLGFGPDETGVIVNGRRINFDSPSSTLSTDDLQILLNYEKKRRLGPVVEAIANLTLTSKISKPQNLASVAALVALSSIPDSPQGIYDNNAVRMSSQDQWSGEHTAITAGNKDTATVQIVGSIDPTSELAQRWIPIIKTLSELEGVFVSVFLNPKPHLKELPVKRFYRYIVDSKPKFSDEGTLVSSGATFEGVPREALLNLGLDVPPAWLVSAKESVYDPDNLKLSAVKSGDVDAIYELKNILIEGHSRDATSGQAPRGVQLLLGTESNPQAADTLVMANLGYFQFKANPGYWNIKLKPGRTEEIFNIDTIGANEQETTSSITELALLSWQGKTLFPRFSRKAGKENEDVLEEAKVASAGDFFAKAKSFGQSILSKTGAVPARKHADINIFSVASGHLYERMLNIMMVSVMKHTSHTVKFWFLEQFLSPSFKRSIPDLAEAYGFEYELVTYKWPHWLRSQKEKQREIWGYKILFLDVLFPLDLDKVIFVDSDQIVRTDMYDLVEHDLEGAPYGFTPMCDSRTEMEGFRFWKQGYWKNFLRGLPYHISALYVVDLQRFRQLAAGDRLRGQYHSLSADPNSLSNLDQDLPNNMQQQLPIHSLPQEWLWCETWCSDESLKDARTIDLCNNPLTKEPKLDRARRQVPEWTVYDDEIAEVFKKAKGELPEAAAGASIQEELDIEQKKKFDAEEAAKKKEKDEL